MEFVVLFFAIAFTAGLTLAGSYIYNQQFNNTNSSGNLTNLLLEKERQKLKIHEADLSKRYSDQVRQLQTSHAILHGEREELRTRESKLREEFTNKLQSIINNEQIKFKIREDELTKSFESELEIKLEKSRKQTRKVNFGNHAQRSILPLMAADLDGISNREIRWFGDTTDFVCFKGLDTPGADVEIVFADAKTSNKVGQLLENKDKWNKFKSYDPASCFLNERQLRVLSAVQDGRVSFQLWMGDEDGSFGIAKYDYMNKCPFV